MFCCSVSPAVNTGGHSRSLFAVVVGSRFVFSLGGERWVLVRLVIRSVIFMPHMSDAFTGKVFLRLFLWLSGG